MADGKSKRVLNEVQKLKESTDTFFLEKSPVDDPSSNVIVGRILPNSNIYNQAAFQIEIKLTDGYPFKPPEVRFLTPIYHPSVDKDGKICVDIINGEGKYNATTPLINIVKAVTDLIDHPQVDHSLNADIGAEYVNNRAEFDRKALESVKQHGQPRQ